MLKNLVFKKPDKTPNFYQVWFSLFLSSEFKTRPMSYILLCDIHHIESVLTTYHLRGYSNFTIFDKQKQNLSD